MKKVAFQRTKTSKLAANELRRINLNGSEIPYTLMRCRRKTIGMRVSSEGLTVRIPMRESLSWVESVLQKKSRLDRHQARRMEEQEACPPRLGRRRYLPSAGGTVASDGYRCRSGADDAGKRERHKQG